MPQNLASSPSFDPDAAAQPGSGVFGLPFTREESRIVLVPVPFDATTSYGGGTSAGPAAIRAASAQVDLFDHQFGNIYQQGIHMLDEPEAIADRSRTARDHAVPIIAEGGLSADPTDEQLHAVAEVKRACEAVEEYVYDEFLRILREGKVPGLVGGDHSTPLGAIKACAEYLRHHHPAGGRFEDVAGPSGRGFGILHVDAHMDFREAFEGFHFSHASIMHNVLTRAGGGDAVSKIVQVGIRDYGSREREFAEKHSDRVAVFYDQDIQDHLASGGAWADVLDKAIAALPAVVYVSFDIDALEPSLCPHTGTPVPGGLPFPIAALLLKKLKDSGRRVIGFDLVEVCPGPNAGEEGGEPEWDAAVGARLLYKLCGVV